MTWAEAVWYAERFGGHLPTPGSSEDLTWLEQLAPTDQSVWIGGGKSGRSAWTMIDGRVWGTTPAPRGTGFYVAVGRLGVRTFDGKTKLPFAIQWRLNGSNPATLGNSLQAVRESLGDANPVYPPGTVAYDSRLFVYVARPVTWRDAAELAELAGGHLAVVSNSAEAGHLAEYLNAQLAENGIWLGGFRGQAGWSWVTGEPWAKGYWADGKEPDGANLGPHVTGLKALVRQSRVPATVPEDAKVQLHPEMSRVATAAAAKQTAINNEFLAEVNRVRQAYQTRLRSEILKAENAGDLARGRALRKEFQNATDNETWLADLGIRAGAELPETAD